MSNPTCEHGECHATRTSSYRWGAANGAGWMGADVLPKVVEMWFTNIPGGKRLCRIHARQEFGVSLG